MSVEHYGILTIHRIGSIDSFLCENETFQNCTIFTSRLQRQRDLGARISQ